MPGSEKFRLQREGPKNILDRLFLAVGCDNFLLKPYLENFRKFSNTPSVWKCHKFITKISIPENEKSVNLKNRFSHYPSRMVFITYFFNAFGFIAEKIWGYLNSSRAFFWVSLGTFWDFSWRERFWYYSSRMVVITYFFNAFGFFAEKIWGYLSSSRAFFWVSLGTFWDFSRRVRFWYHSSRMVVITYFFNTFEFFAVKIWVILSNSRAFFGSIQAFLETFWEEFDSGTVPRGWLL